MSGMKTKSTRRAFFLQGGAVLGAGVATTVGAENAPVDREEIRKLQWRFMSCVEQQNYKIAATLFTDPTHLDLSDLNTHSTYRQSSSQQHDTIAVAEDRLRAEATFHVEVEVCTPLQEDCTAAQMARLQGNIASRRWEAGRFDAQYVKGRDGWKIVSFRYRAA